MSAAVAVVSGSVVYLSAPPASAAEAPPALQAEIDLAVLDAGIELAERPGCNALLSETGLFVGSPAIDILDTSRTTFQPVPPAPLPASTVASVRGFGLGQEIAIHQAFDELGVTRELKFAGQKEISSDNPAIQRAVAILHEIGHLSGVEGAHEGRVDEAGNPISADLEERLYNTRILNTCFAPTASALAEIPGPSCITWASTSESTCAAATSRRSWKHCPAVPAWRSVSSKAPT